MKPVCACLAACFVLLLLAASSTADEKAARRVLDAAIKAAGGKEKLSKFERMTWKEKGTYYGMGDGLPYEGDYALNLPSQFKMEIADVFTSVLNQDKGWVKTPDGVTEMTDEQVAEQKLRLHAGRVTNLVGIQGEDFELELIGNRKLEFDKSAVTGVNVKCKGQRDVELYFDKDSGLLKLAQYTVKAAELGGKEVPFEVYYQNYKEIDGAQVATKLTMKQDGELFIEANIEEGKPVDQFAEGTFAKP